MEATNERPRLRIGQLAAELGLNPKTIRYYEDIGLLPQPERTPGGYRLYDTSARDRLQFIDKAKALGLSLEEIHEVLTVCDGGSRPCEHVLTLLDQKLAEVDEQIKLLTDFRADLLGIRQTAVETMPGEGAMCRIIEHHTLKSPGSQDSSQIPRRRRRR